MYINNNGKQKGGENMGEQESVWTNQQLVKELEATPELKRRLVMRVAQDLLESEAFMEAYPPRMYDAERAKNDAEYKEGVVSQMAKIITRFLTKNRVTVEDATLMLDRARRIYGETYSHSDKSQGPGSSQSSHS